MFVAEGEKSDGKSSGNNQQSKACSANARRSAGVFSFRSCKFIVFPRRNSAMLLSRLVDYSVGPKSDGLITGTSAERPARESKSLFRVGGA